MTDDKKHDDKDRKKLSDEEMEDVAGGTVDGRAKIGGFVGGGKNKKDSDDGPIRATSAEV